MEEHQLAGKGLTTTEPVRFVQFASVYNCVYIQLHMFIYSKITILVGYIYIYTHIIYNKYVLVDSIC